MPKGNEKSKNTVRSRSTRSSRTVLCVAVFVVTALAVYCFGSRKDSQSAGAAGSVGLVRATVRQQFPADGALGLSRPTQGQVEQEIIGEANLRRAFSVTNGGNVTDKMIKGLAETLHVSLGGGSPDDMLEVSIASTDNDLDRAVGMVNILARQYAADQNAKYASATARSCRDARAATEAAGRKFFEAQARLHRFLEGHFGQHGDQARRTWTRQIRQVSFSQQPRKGESAPGPGMVENPEWLELARRVSELTAKMDVMLQDMTLQHPEVRGIDAKINNYRQVLEKMPRYLPRSAVDPDMGAAVPGSRPKLRVLPPPPAQGRPSSPSSTGLGHAAAVRDFQMHKVVVDETAAAFERLSSEERQAWIRQSRPPVIELQLAGVDENPPESHRPAGTIPVALMVALAMAGGVGMIVSGLGEDPTLDNAEQVRHRLSIPVVGVIPAPNPGAVQANRRRSSPSSGIALIGYGAVLLLVGVLILLTAGG